MGGGDSLCRLKIFFAFKKQTTVTVFLSGKMLMYNVQFRVNNYYLFIPNCTLTVTTVLRNKKRRVKNVQRIQKI